VCIMALKIGRRKRSTCNRTGGRVNGRIAFARDRELGRERAKRRLAISWRLSSVLNLYPLDGMDGAIGKQHWGGELTFWSALRIDPLNVALRLWTVSADVEAGERTVFWARQRINLAKAFG
jgi:hypothetical protein